MYLGANQLMFSGRLHFIIVHTPMEIQISILNCVENLNLKQTKQSPNIQSKKTQKISLFNNTERERRHHDNCPVSSNTKLTNQHTTLCFDDIYYL